MNPNNPIQTLVVSLDQLTAENMAQLAQAGYSILRDPNLVIFGRAVPNQAQTQAANNGVSGDESGQENEPAQLPIRQ